MEEPSESGAPGRILRLKLGFNPSSSSIGTIVFAMPAAMIGLTVAFGAAAALSCSALLHRQQEEPPDESASPPKVRKKRKKRKKKKRRSSSGPGA